MSSQLEELRALFPASEIFEQGDPKYHEQSQPWSKYAELHPKLVIQPTTLDDIQKVVRFLYESDLDFAVRNTGTGSVSARDVILSTHGFKSFAFDRDAETVTIGSGFDWGEVDALMEEKAEGYTVVGARCTPSRPFRHTAHSTTLILVPVAGRSLGRRSRLDTSRRTELAEP